MKPRLRIGSAGFTLIEVLIVTAIAGVLLLSIFLIVPAANRNSRNYERKAAVNYVYSALSSYYNDNGGLFPYYGTPATDKRSDFLARFNDNNPAKAYQIAYTDSNMSHSMPYDNDPSGDTESVYVFPGHFCQRDPNIGPGDGDYPVQGSSASSDDYRYIAVLMILEGAKAYCVDNRT